MHLIQTMNLHRSKLALSGEQQTRLAVQPIYRAIKMKCQ